MSVRRSVLLVVFAVLAALVTAVLIAVRSTPASSPGGTDKDRRSPSDSSATGPGRSSRPRPTAFARIGGICVSSAPQARR